MRRIQLLNMVNDSSNPNKLVMSYNSIIDNSCFKTLFGRQYVDLSSFADSYEQSELLHLTQIVELDRTLVDISFNNSCTKFTNLTHGLYTLTFPGIIMDNMLVAS